MNYNYNFDFELNSPRSKELLQKFGGIDHAYNLINVFKDYGINLIPQKRFDTFR